MKALLFLFTIACLLLLVVSAAVLLVMRLSGRLKTPLKTSLRVAATLCLFCLQGNGAIVSAFAFSEKIEKTLGPDAMVLFHWPRWACGDIPPYVVVEASRPEYAEWRLKDTRAFIRGGSAGNVLPFVYPGTDYPLVNFSCYGRFKQSARLFLWETFESEPPGLGTGIYFDADFCVPARLTETQSEMIERYLHPDRFEPEIPPGLKEETEPPGC